MFSKSRHCAPTTWLVRFPECTVIFLTGLQFHSEVLIDCFVKKILFGVILFLSRLDLIIFLQDLIFLLLVASALMAIDIATNRWRGLRAETKTADLLIETAIFLDRIAIYCEVLINCLDVDVIYKYSMVGYASLLYCGDYAISFFLLALLALAISGRAKIVEWKLDTAVMMHVQEIKRCSFI